MRQSARALLMIGLLALAGGGAPAWAAKKVKLPARARVPVVRTTAAAAGLRGAQPPVSAALPAPPSLGWPPHPALPRFGQGQTSLASAGLVGLRSRADTAPLCRTACAQARYQCQSGDNGDSCDGAWGRCVIACREPPRP